MMKTFKFQLLILFLDSILKTSVSNDLESIKIAGEKVAALLSEVCSLVNSINSQAKNSSNLLGDATNVIETGIQNEVKLLIWSKVFLENTKLEFCCVRWSLITL